MFPVPSFLVVFYCITLSLAFYFHPFVSSCILSLIRYVFVCLFPLLCLPSFCFLSTFCFLIHYIFVCLFPLLCLPSFCFLSVLSFILYVFICLFAVLSFHCSVFVSGFFLYKCLVIYLMTSKILNKRLSQISLCIVTLLSSATNPLL